MSCPPSLVKCFYCDVILPLCLFDRTAAMNLLPPGGSLRDNWSECDCLRTMIPSLCAASLTVRICFRVQLEGEGTYECSVTGLVFEASERVLVRYSVLSWSKYSSFLQDSWKFAGPIFNVDTVPKDAPALTSIQFPHSVCLAGENEPQDCLTPACLFC